MCHECRHKNGKLVGIVGREKEKERRIVECLIKRQNEWLSTSLHWHHCIWTASGETEVIVSGIVNLGTY